MAKTMTPSDLTKPVAGKQVQKIEDLVGAAVRKSGLPGACVQQLIEQHGVELLREFLGVLEDKALELVGVASRSIYVPPELARDPRRALELISVMSYHHRQIRDEPAAHMPHGKPGPVVVTLFECPCLVKSYEDMVKEYKIRGLNPADPATLGVLCRKYGGLLHEAQYLVTSWEDPTGMWCAAKVTHRPGDGETFVSVEEVSQIGGHWFLAGVPIGH
jgi:hypothetical protein